MTGCSGCSHQSPNARVTKHICTYKGRMHVKTACIRVCSPSSTADRHQLLSPDHRNIALHQTAQKHSLAGTLAEPSEAL